MNAQLISQAPAASAASACADAALTCRLKQVLDGGPDAINDRLAHLDREWTAGRAAKVFAGLLIIAGLVLTAVVNPWWLLLAAAGAALLLPYLFGRRSPAAYLFHAGGLRFGTELDEERMALKALRGDFQHLPTVHQVEDRDAITRLEGEGGIVVEPEAAKVGTDEAVREVIGATKR